MNRHLTAVASTLVLGALLSTGTQAATPSPLFTRVFPTTAAVPSALFSGGATVNGGAGFVTSIPADQKAGIVATLVPAAADIGKDASIYMVINAGNAWYMRTPTGFATWNTQVGSLVPYGSAVLAASQTINVTDLEALAGQDFDGKTLRVHVGYQTNTSPLTYGSAIEFAMASTPASTCPNDGFVGIPPAVAGGKRLCVLSGTYTKDVHLTNNFEYIVGGPVFFGVDNAQNVTLTIDAGVKTYGESGADFIRVSRGSKIYVNGTKDAPVIMTGAAEATATASTTGLWGGLVVNGNARVNGCTEGTALCERTAEGNAGTYGGNNDAESSGTINYLIVKYAGFEISPGNELNGITLNGVGSGTVVDYVQVHNGSDDGFELFGGTVNAKHLVLTGNDDDNVDWQTGWRGKIQHVLVLHKSVGDRGIEADNNNAARDSLPRSKGQIANMTIIGKSSNGHGIKLRDGTAANLYNFVVKSAGAGCLDIDHGPTFLNGGSSATALTGELTIINSLFDCTNALVFTSGDNWSTPQWFLGQQGNLVGASSMTGYINSATVNARPAAPLGGDGFFDQVDYIGAVKDAANDWTVGWTFRQPFTTLLP
ncbi:MAG: hypothetical protein RLZZ227_3021 [Pseudomonadota bacterium]|jgi:hypothetical protein